MLLFYFPRPKSHYGTGRNKDILKDNSPIWFTKRKDLDNLIKFVLDSLNGQAYFDDSQIVSIHAYKFYTCEEPRVQVRLRKLVGWYSCWMIFPYLEMMFTVFCITVDRPDNRCFCRNNKWSSVEYASWLLLRSILWSSDSGGSDEMICRGD